MFSAFPDFQPYLVYAAPPLIGAFIGYLTNRIAIRMLFRPLKKWTIGPLRIPMTPGVIPSKRHEFAENIGTMVGEHLLTDEELTSALLKEPFQNHLHEVFHTRLTDISKLDIGSINNLVPDTYRSYLDIGFKTGVYRLKHLVHSNISSESGEHAIETFVDRWLDDVFERDVKELVSDGDVERFFSGLETSLAEVLEDADLTPVLTSMALTVLTDTRTNQKTLRDILPEQVQETIVETIRSQTPYLLEKAADILQDPDVREKIISALKQGVEEMVDGMGPMSTMVKGFLDMDLVDRTIREYLSKREDDITVFLSDEAIHHRVRAGLGERINLFLDKPVSEFLDTSDKQGMHRLASDVARGLNEVLENEQIRNRLSTAVREILENEYQKNMTTVASVLARLGGPGSTETLRKTLKREILSLLQSPEFVTFLDGAIETFCTYLVNRPIGKLSHLIPSGIIDGAAKSLTQKTTETIAEEMPVIVASLDISKIITERIDSFDLLRLERLLLSIMQEQFKYINLFGALLGFLIGCINLLVLLGIG